MFRNALVKVVSQTARVQPRVKASIPEVTPSCTFVRSFTDAADEARPPFDPSLLEVLVCPLSKKPLRYEAKTNELINEELGIAYPITDGIPNMIPQEARLLQRDEPTAPAQE